jgi:O-antigen ligase
MTKAANVAGRMSKCGGARAGSWVVASALLLYAVSYGKLYLFHVALALMWAGVFARSGPKSIYVERSIFPFFVWTALGFLWSRHPGALALQCVFFFFGFSVLFAFDNFVRTEGELRRVFRLMAWIVVAEYAISLLECFGVVRLPTSMFSPWVTYFGREPYDPVTAGTTYFLEPPTGFMGNPNNLAFVLNLAFPFILFARQRWLVILGTVVHAVVLLFIQSRIGYFVFVAEVIVGCVMLGRAGVRYMAVLAVLLVGMGVVFVSRFADVFDLGKTISLLESMQRFIFGGGYENDSIGVRRELLTQAWGKFCSSPVLGIGAGGFAEEAAVDYGGTLLISDLHNMWMQILVEGGVIGASAYIWFHGGIIWRTVRLSVAGVPDSVRYYLRSSLLSLCGGVVGVVSMSSAYYVLPFWVSLGFGVAIIRVSNAASARSPLGL